MFQHIGRQAYRSGLDNTYRLDTYFGKPHRNFPSVHVGGTNGKGSVSHMLASVLQESGYNVGLYTSPHLLDFRERIKVNGKLIKREFITEFVHDNKPFFDSFQPSFFEISVYLAFCYFVHCRVDIAVIEVGLGGRLDATNIISPELSVITNIGKDHTEILGDTLPRIAAEKAGIIKLNTPVVIGESHPETMPVFEVTAKERDASLHAADKIFRVIESTDTSERYQVFNVLGNNTLSYPNLKCGLLGHYQRKNIVTLLAAIEQLKKTCNKIDNPAVYNGIRNVIKNTGLAGRWQIMGHNPTTVCDTAHNTDGLYQVLQQVADIPNNKLHLVIGFVNDKDTSAILTLLPVHARYYFTRLSVPRTLDEKELKTRAMRQGLNGYSFANINEAYQCVRENAGKDDLVVITGSTFLVGDFLRMKNSMKPEDGS